MTETVEQGSAPSSSVVSADGTRIAYDWHGSGPAVILVSAAMQFRAFDPATVALAQELADRGFTVLHYDRRGRGESGDTLPYAVERGIEDIGALVEVAGGQAALFGSSSGAVLCLHAAAAGLAISRLVLWEAPLEPDGQGDSGPWLAELQSRLAVGDRAGAVEFYMSDMPVEWLEGAKASPRGRPCSRSRRRWPTTQPCSRGRRRRRGRSSGRRSPCRCWR